MRRLAQHVAETTSAPPRFTDAELLFVLERERLRAREERAARLRVTLAAGGLFALGLGLAAWAVLR